MPLHAGVTKRVLRCAAGVGGKVGKKQKMKNIVDVNIRSTVYFS
jgi:hypothetical protein